MIYLFQVYFLLHLYRFHLFQLRLDVRLHLLLSSLCEPHIEVRLVGQQALDQLSIFTLEEAEYGHTFLIIMLAVPVGLGLEVSEEAQDAPRPLPEAHAHLLLELLTLVSSLVLHGFPPIIL